MAVQKQDRRARDARHGRLGRTRYDALVSELASVIRLAFEVGATTTLWGLEGPMRHAIRSDLCLQGWGWRAADEMALVVLAEAFRTVGAKRPSWNEGQLEWTIEAGTLIERTRCAGCHKPLPEGQHKFCNHLCASSYHSHTYRKKVANEDHAIWLATKSNRST